MSPLRICLLCADVSRNALGRAYVLARVLARDHEVQVVGPRFGASVWPPMAGLLERHGIQMTAVPSHRLPRFLASIPKLWKAINADLVYALKPYPTSYGLGLLFRSKHDVPLVLDIDDWELGTFRAMDRRQLLLTVATGIASPNNYLWLRQLYRQTTSANAITVSSGFLQRKYGGFLVPHGRDTVTMDPGRVSGDKVRNQWGLTGKVVMFLGTSRPPKGVEDLIAAVHRLGRSDVWCVIVGAEELDPYTARLGAQAGKRVRLLPMQPFEGIPEFLAAADVVAVPQRRTPFTEAQVPAKLFDAMAMARPIVSTAVSDIPEILDGCGVIVQPGDVQGLTIAIAQLLDNPDGAAALGRRAREKCTRMYSWDAMRATLESVVEYAIGRH